MSTTFEIAIEEATKAANDAGNKWIEERIAGTGMHLINGNIVNNRGESVNPMLDACGFAHVSITDGRTAFAKYLKKKKGDRHIYSVPLDYIHRGRQDLGLKEACVTAAYKVLKGYGINGIGIYSRID